MLLLFLMLVLLLFFVVAPFEAGAAAVVSVKNIQKKVNKGF